MIRVSCVSYLNSQPFIEGIGSSPIRDEIDLALDIPSVCGEKLKSGTADIGLVPAVLLPEIPGGRVISDFCIGADGPVDTVLLLSRVPLDRITHILPDSDSRTSVMLARILCRRFWNIRPSWLPAGSALDASGETTAVIAIGDKAFGLAARFPYVTDLAAAWKEHTSLPFVFACWVANKPLPGDFLSRFNAALATGIAALPATARKLAARYPGVDVQGYLETKISFTLDVPKREALQLFLDWSAEMTAA
jgi:chorismate dehydratase